MKERMKKENKNREQTYRLWCRRMVRCICLCLCLCMLAGCNSNVQIKLTTGLNQGELFRIENKSCTVSEAKLFLMNQKNRYEEAYGEHIWSVPVAEDDFAGYMKEQLKNFLSQLTCMVLMAQNRGISLSEEEESLAAQAAEEYFTSLTEQETAYLEIQQEDVTALYRDYRLAERLVSQVTAGVQREISDDEARVIEVQQIVWYKTGTDEEGNPIALSQEETEALRRTAQAVADRAAQGDSFSNLQEVYSDEEPGTIRVSRYDVGQAWEETVFSLGSGEISGVIEAEEAFYVVRCVNNLLEEETVVNKDVIRERQKAEVFYREYDAFTADLTALYDEEGWKKLSFTDEIPSGSADFYEIYDKYFKS